MSLFILGAAANQDLNDIWEYIAQDSIDAADRWVARLFDAFEALALTPRMGHSREDLTPFPVLFWPVDAYLVIYQLRRGRVEIVAVTQGNRNIPEFIFNRLS